MLVADDNEATRTLIRALLRNDFVVETADDGNEAIAKLKSRQYAVILLDLLMPRADGYSVLDFIRSETPEQLGRTIVLTASVTAAEMSRAGAYEVGKVLAKPFDIDDLVAVTRALAAGS